MEEQLSTMTQREWKLSFKKGKKAIYVGTISGKYREVGWLLKNAICCTLWTSDQKQSSDYTIFLFFSRPVVVALLPSSPPLLFPAPLPPSLHHSPDESEELMALHIDGSVTWSLKQAHTHSCIYTSKWQTDFFNKWLSVSMGVRGWQVGDPRSPPRVLLIGHFGGR